jgi:hypothetical protein
MDTHYQLEFAVDGASESWKMEGCAHFESECGLVVRISQGLAGLTLVPCRARIPNAVPQAELDMAVLFLYTLS